MKYYIPQLEHYGVRGKALDWFRSYLEQRRQYVIYGGVHSDISYVEYGVPQGPVLGPLLFILCSNDLPIALKNCHTILFADDTTIYTTGTDLLNINSDIMRKSFVYQGPQWWASLNDRLKASKTKSSFKTRLKLSLCSHLDITRVISRTKSGFVYVNATSPDQGPGSVVRENTRTSDPGTTFGPDQFICERYSFLGPPLWRCGLYEEERTHSGS